MRKRILSIIMAVVVMYTSMDVSVFAAELGKNVGEVNQVQAEETVAADADAEDNISSMGEMGSASEIEDEISEAGEEVSEDYITIDTLEESEDSQEVSESDGKTEDLKKEEDIVNDESVDEEDEISENNEVDYDLITEENNSVELEEEMIQDVYTVQSSSSLNTDVKNIILSYKSKYPEGKNWDSNNNGFEGYYQCIGFTVKLTKDIFGKYPYPLRRAEDGASSNGWICYYVNSSNYNSLTIEPGDIIDCPTSSSSNHTAMVLSVDNGVIKFACTNLMTPLSTDNTIAV